MFRLIGVNTDNLSQLQQPRDGPSVAHVQQSVSGRPAACRRCCYDSLRHNDSQKKILIISHSEKQHSKFSSCGLETTERHTHVNPREKLTNLSGDPFHSKGQHYSRAHTHRVWNYESHTHAPCTHTSAMMNIERLCRILILLLPVIEGKLTRAQAHTAVDDLLQTETILFLRVLPWITCLRQTDEWCVSHKL